MTRRFPAALLLLICIVLLTRCSPGDIVMPLNTMHAKVDLAEFNSVGNDVKVAFPTNSFDTTKTELVISGTTGNPNDLTFLLIQIFDFDKSNGIGTYVFDSSHATGLYSPGSGTEDFFVNGSVVITTSGSTIAGTFTGTTQSGIKVTSGDFSVQP
jgi:hypothetical protein